MGLNTPILLIALLSLVCKIHAQDSSDITKSKVFRGNKKATLSDVIHNDGKYRPDFHVNYRPDYSALMFDNGHYKSDSAGQYMHQDLKYVHLEGPQGPLGPDALKYVHNDKAYRDNSAYISGNSNNEKFEGVNYENRNSAARGRNRNKHLGTTTVQTENVLNKGEEAGAGRRVVGVRKKLVRKNKIEQNTRVQDINARGNLGYHNEHLQYDNKLDKADPIPLPIIQYLQPPNFSTRHIENTENANKHETNSEEVQTSFPKENSGNIENPSEYFGTSNPITTETFSPTTENYDNSPPNQIASTNLNSVDASTRKSNLLRVHKQKIGDGNQFGFKDNDKTETEDSAGSQENTPFFSNTQIGENKFGSKQSYQSDAHNYNTKNINGGFVNNQQSGNYNFNNNPQNFRNSNSGANNRKYDARKSQGSATRQSQGNHFQGVTRNSKKPAVGQEIDINYTKTYKYNASDNNSDVLISTTSTSISPTSDRFNTNYDNEGVSKFNQYTDKYTIGDSFKSNQSKQTQSVSNQQNDKSVTEKAESRFNLQTPSVNYNKKNGHLGKYTPDDSGHYNPDSSGQYRHFDNKYVHQKDKFGLDNSKIERYNHQANSRQNYEVTDIKYHDSEQNQQSDNYYKLGHNSRNVEEYQNNNYATKTYDHKQAVVDKNYYGSNPSAEYNYADKKYEHDEEGSHGARNNNITRHYKQNDNNSGNDYIKEYTNDYTTKNAYLDQSGQYNEDNEYENAESRRRTGNNKLEKYKNDFTTKTSNQFHQVTEKHFHRSDLDQSGQYHHADRHEQLEGKSNPENGNLEKYINDYTTKASKHYPHVTENNYYGSDQSGQYHHTDNKFKHNGSAVDPYNSGQYHHIDNKYVNGKDKTNSGNENGENYSEYSEQPNSFSDQASQSPTLQYDQQQTNSNLLNSKITGNPDYYNTQPTKSQDNAYKNQFTNEYNNYQSNDLKTKSETSKSQHSSFGENYRPTHSRKFGESTPINNGHLSQPKTINNDLNNVVAQTKKQEPLRNGEVIEEEPRSDVPVVYIGYGNGNSLHPVHGQSKNESGNNGNSDNRNNGNSNYQGTPSNDANYVNGSANSGSSKSTLDSEKVYYNPYSIVSSSTRNPKTSSQAQIESPTSYEQQPQISRKNATGHTLRFESSAGNGVDYGFGKNNTEVISQTGGEQSGSVLYRCNQVSNDGYRFKFDTADGIKQDEEGALQNRGTEREAMCVTGYYTYLGPDNKEYKVYYTADEYGFRPEGDHIHPEIKQLLKNLQGVPKQNK